MSEVLKTGSWRNCTMHSPGFRARCCKWQMNYWPSRPPLTPTKCSQPKILTKNRIAGMNQVRTIITITYRILIKEAMK